MLRKCKTAMLSAAIAVGVLAGVQTAMAVSADLSPSDIYGEWTGTYQYTSPPEVLSTDSMTITDETDYEPGPQPIVIKFEESADDGFAFIPVIGDEYYDGAYRRLDSAVISGNQLSWTETIADDLDDVLTDLARIQYTLSFSADLTQQYLDGELAGEFLVGEPGVAFQAFSLRDDGEWEEYFVPTGAVLQLSRTIDSPPVSAIPLPPAFSAGLMVLGGLGLTALVRQRRRSVA